MANAAKIFKVAILGVSRQVGKSTLNKHFLSGMGVRRISFNDPNLRKTAKHDPELFLKQYAPPLMIDEFQYVPELILLKSRCRRIREWMR